MLTHHETIRQHFAIFLKFMAKISQGQFQFAFARDCNYIFYPMMSSVIAMIAIIIIYSLESRDISIVVVRFIIVEFLGNSVEKV